MLDILTDNLLENCLYLINIQLRFINDTQLELLPDLTYLVPWLLEPEMDLYDTEQQKRFRVKVPIRFRKQGRQVVYKTAGIAIPVTEIYLL